MQDICHGTLAKGSFDPQRGCVPQVEKHCTRQCLQPPITSTLILWDHASKGNRCRCRGQQYPHECTAESWQPALGLSDLTCLPPKGRLSARPKKVSQSKGVLSGQDVGCQLQYYPDRATLSSSLSGCQERESMKHGSSYNVLLWSHNKEWGGGLESGSVVKNVHCYSRGHEFMYQAARTGL